VPMQAPCDSVPMQAAGDSVPMQDPCDLVPMQAPGVFDDVPVQYLLDGTSTVGTSDRSGIYDDLLPILTYLRQSELPDNTSITVSKGLLQRILESGMSVV